MSQHQIFIESEADRWFERNGPALAQFRPEADLPLRMIEMYGIRPRSAIEIGAANGVRVAEIRRRFGTRVVAVEPSAGAIADGRRRFPDVDFRQAVASDTGVDERFDLAIVNYVFHWIDRGLLFAAVAEIDRLVADGGFLLIGDFAPVNLLRVRYHHLPEQEVYTYKQSYASIFLASGIYQEVATLTGVYPVKELHVESSDDSRGGGWLLHKRLHANYVEGRFPGASNSR